MLPLRLNWLKFKREQRAYDIVLDLVHQLAEQLKPFFLIGYQRVLLTVGSQADPVLEVVHFQQMVPPSDVDGPQENVVLNLVHHVLAVLGVLRPIHGLSPFSNGARQLSLCIASSRRSVSSCMVMLMDLPNASSTMSL